MTPEQAVADALNIPLADVVMTEQQRANVIVMLANNPAAIASLFIDEFEFPYTSALNIAG